MAFKNFRPYTIGMRHADGTREIDDHLITEKPQEIIDAVCAWIKTHLHPVSYIPKKTPSSYGLKHMLERDTGIYLRNNAFKDAMLMCGYFPVDARELNWRYRASLTKQRSNDNG